MGTRPSKNILKIIKVIRRFTFRKLLEHKAESEMYQNESKITKYIEQKSHYNHN